MIGKKWVVFGLPACGRTGQNLSSSNPYKNLTLFLYNLTI